jgi:hypothetical protein
MGLEYWQIARVIGSTSIYKLAIAMALNRFCLHRLTLIILFS